MFANVRQENPAEWIFRLRQGCGGQVRLPIQAHRTANLISFSSILLEKHNVAPRRRAKVAGIVVGISRPGEPVIRELVPLFARDFASLATDANTRIGEEANLHPILHKGMLPLIRALDSLADHNAEVMEAGTME